MPRIHPPYTISAQQPRQQFQHGHSPRHPQKPSLPVLQTLQMLGNPRRSPRRPTLHHYPNRHLALPLQENDVNLPPILGRFAASTQRAALRVVQALMERTLHILHNLHVTRPHLQIPQPRSPPARRRTHPACITAARKGSRAVLHLHARRVWNDVESRGIQSLAQQNVVRRRPERWAKEV
jgi:hypothetical protein